MYSCTPRVDWPWHGLHSHSRCRKEDCQLEELKGRCYVHSNHKNQIPSLIFSKLEWIIILKQRRQGSSPSLWAHVPRSINKRIIRDVNINYAVRRCRHHTNWFRFLKMYADWLWIQTLKCQGHAAEFKSNLETPGKRIGGSPPATAIFIFNLAGSVPLILDLPVCSVGNFSVCPRSMGVPIECSAAPKKMVLFEVYTLLR